jgi:hypothetical protein
LITPVLVVKRSPTTAGLVDVEDRGSRNRQRFNICHCDDVCAAHPTIENGDFAQPDRSLYPLRAVAAEPTQPGRHIHGRQ